MTPAGRRNTRIAFEQAALERGQLGAKTAKAWTERGKRWARALYGSGQERREAAVEAASQPATFNVLADNLTKTITVQDRIRHAGLAYDIIGIVPIGTGPREIEFTGVASRDLKR